ncbi:MAG: hypothetical protein V7750_09715 [Sneathiella sp.]
MWQMRIVLYPIVLFAVQVSGCIQSPEQNAFEPNIPDGEHIQIDEIASLTPVMQTKRAEGLKDQGGKVLRGVHPKSHGCVQGEFTVFGSEELGSEFRRGIFAKAGRKYNADIRFSNAEVHTGGDLDGGNGSRGMAIKLYDVDGEVFIKDNSQKNQDFLMINTPEFAFRNITDYGRLTRALEASKNAVDTKDYSDFAFEPPKDEAEKEKLIAGLKATGRVVGGIKSRTVRNPVFVQYFGAAPFLFGQGKAMKFSAKPKMCPPKPATAAFKSKLGEAEKNFSSSEKAVLGPNYLRDALTKTVEAEEVCFDFMIQVRDKSEVDMLQIEDATTQWEDELDNYVAVALLRIKSGQLPQSDKSIATCEALAFTPWHSLKEHQPLGSINRLRRDVYQGSSYHRLEAETKTD